MLHTTLLSLIIVGIASASVSAQPNFARISSAASSNCLDVNLDDIRTPQLSDCNNASPWFFDSPPAVTTIRSARISLCLDNIGIDAVQLRPCNGSPTQIWVISPGANDHLIIRGRLGGLCISVDTDNQIVISPNCFGRPSGWDLLGIESSLTSQNLD